MGSGRMKEEDVDSGKRSLPILCLPWITFPLCARPSFQRCSCHITRDSILQRGIERKKDKLNAFHEISVNMIEGSHTLSIGISREL